MDVAALVGAVLEDMGTAVAVIKNPQRAGDATICHVNQPFADFFRKTPADLLETRLAGVEALTSDPVAWATVTAALRTGNSVSLDLALRPEGVERWIGLRMAFSQDLVTGMRHAVLVGRDITETRRHAAREDAFRRLLAAIFTRVSAPVAIVAVDGGITMANPAFHQLVGMAAAEVQGMKVDDLTPPEYLDAARSARARQMADGLRYDMPFEVLAKGSIRKPCWLTSMLLRDGDQRMRVVTIVPDMAEKTEILAVTRDVGEVRAVSLEAFRSIFGENWEKIATRAMLKAEQIIRRRLGRDDVLSRSDDHKFVIWFSGTDSDRNEAVLAGAVREIRLLFLTDFGEEAAAHVTSAVTPGRGSAPRLVPPPSALPTSNRGEPKPLAKRWTQ